MNSHRKFQPDWVDKKPPYRSFRSIFKWGQQDTFKHPGKGFFTVIKKELDLKDTDFFAPSHLGGERIKDNGKINISKSLAARFEAVVGKENISINTYDRVKYSSGKSMEEILELRFKKINDICDIVVHPRHKKDVQDIIELCHENHIPVHVYGGGSSVTLGLTCPKGGVTLVLNTHMNQVVAFNEINQTITIQAGMMGPDYERVLNKAPEKFNASRPYTGGHFPQSFEHSSVDGWVVTLGSDQASSLYGNAYDMVISQEYVTPAGTIKTHEYPSCATGPKINDMIKGSEGCFGVLVAATMKIFPYYPRYNRPFTFMFPGFKAAVSAGRRISQSGSGMPAILRVSDPEETDVALKIYGLDNGFFEKFLQFKNLYPKKRCLVMGQCQGPKAFTRHVFKQVKKQCRRKKGMYLTGYPMTIPSA